MTKSGKQRPWREKKIDNVSYSEILDILKLKKAHEILMKDEAYRNAHHCTGFFKTTLPGFYSVVKDICTPNYERKES
ncbi:hypothetical protein [Staphylococcus capitis]|uniref:hypothetical protein n=1 Tax=Staphylococcus capitis TaxID=29388 RepID=UPI001F5483C5|nr:hypothetical protein [Staphylococcus capitis]